MFPLSIILQQASRLEVSF